jgi:hypothetical protein
MRHEPVLARRLHRERAARAAAAATAGEHEHGEDRGSVQAVLAPVPTPIGVGAAYHPPAAIHATCRPAAVSAGRRVHIELFANRRVAIVPTGVGVRGGRRTFGRIVSARCRARLWTLDPTGVVHYEARATLGAFFTVWGQRLGTRHLLGFDGDVRLYLNGRRVRGDPRTLVLHDLDEIVLEVGGYVPPHRSFRFPPH